MKVYLETLQSNLLQESRMIKQVETEASEDALDYSDADFLYFNLLRKQNRYLETLEIAKLNLREKD